MCVGLHVQNTLFRRDFNETWIFSTDFRKTPKYLISCKSVQRKPSCSMRTERKTDMTKPVVTFRSSAVAPKSQRQLSRQQSWYQSRIWNSKLLNTSRILYLCTYVICVARTRIFWWYHFYYPTNAFNYIKPFFFLLALQPPMGVVFYSPLAGFSLLAYEVSWSHTTTRHSR